MYDQEKGQIVFKNQDERENWISKCEKIVMKEYYNKGRFLYDMWKKDGERFLSEEFLKGSSFPYLNDGRPEFFEWAGGSGLFSFDWDYDDNLVEAKNFLISMSKTFSINGNRLQLLVTSLNMILVQLITAREYYDEEDNTDQNAYDESAYVYDEAEDEHNEEG